MSALFKIKMIGQDHAVYFLGTSFEDKPVATKLSELAAMMSLSVAVSYIKELRAQDHTMFWRAVMILPSKSKLLTEVVGAPGLLKITKPPATIHRPKGWFGTEARLCKISEAMARISQSGATVESVTKNLRQATLSETFKEFSNHYAAEDYNKTSGSQ